MIFCVIVIALLTFSCKSKEKSKLPDKNDKVTEFATIPEYKVVLLQIAKTNAGSLKSIPLDTIKSIKDDTLYVAFTWGVLSCNAQLAVQSKNKDMLQTYLQQMIKIAPKLSLADMGDKIERDLIPMLAQNDWSLVETSLGTLQGIVQERLLQCKMYELYTVETFGEWTQMTSSVSKLMKKNYNKDIAASLLQSEAWQSLSLNFDLVTNPAFTTKQLFKDSAQQCRDMAKFLATITANAPTASQIEQISYITDCIRTPFLGATGVK